MKHVGNIPDGKSCHSHCRRCGCPVHAIAQHDSNTAGSSQPQSMTILNWSSRIPTSFQTAANWSNSSHQTAAADAFFGCVMPKDIAHIWPINQISACNRLAASVSSANGPGQRLHLSGCILRRYCPCLNDAFVQAGYIHVSNLCAHSGVVVPSLLCSCCGRCFTCTA